jgi:hypothetical protein
MSKTFLLRGIDGSNPLGFLAAVGTLRMLPGARLGWRMEEGLWRPQLITADMVSEEGLCERLSERSRLEPPEIPMLGKNLTVAPEVFSTYVDKAAQLLSAGDSRAAEYVAAFGSEACVDQKKNRIEYTSFSFITGSGHQDFVTTALKLSENVTTVHIREALFGPWEYKDKSLSFRWDPADAAEYALSAGDPSKDGARTMWGVNRLAFEALPLLPVQPTRRGLRTTGFREEHYPEEFTWPVWDAALDADTVRSLLSLSDLQEESPLRPILRAMGIEEVFRSPRVRIGLGANFKVSFRPARSV